MTAPRHTRVIAALIEARGCWVNSDTLSAQLGVGKPQVAAAISEARAELSKEMGGVTIETHKFRGVGWRIVPAATAPAPPPAPAPEAPPAPAAETAPQFTALPGLIDSLAEGQLAPRARAMLARLRLAAGEFVDGRTLAEHCDCEIDSLSNIARQINRRLPSARVEALRGHGFRLGSLASGAPVGTERRRPAVPMPQRDTQRAAIDLLRELHPGLAEKVRSVALEAGETAGETIYRLIEYGIEVHHSLIVAGEHPLQLGRAA